jgi:hypothetical protein
MPNFGGRSLIASKLKVRRWIIEIGCGARPQPPRGLTDDECYVATELGPAVLAAPAGRLRVRTDARSLCFADASISCVIARNIFGDAGLGFTAPEITGFNTGVEYTAWLRTLVAEGRMVELATMRARLRAAAERVWAAKLAILGEIERVLEPGGRAVMIETMTPDQAQTFMGRLESAFGARVGKLAWRRLEGHRRLRKYCTDAELASRVLRAWVFDRETGGPEISAP